MKGEEQKFCVNCAHHWFGAPGHLCMRLGKKADLVTGEDASVGTQVYCKDERCPEGRFRCGPMGRFFKSSGKKLV